MKWKHAYCMEIVKHICYALVPNTKRTWTQYDFYHKVNNVFKLLVISHKKMQHGTLTMYHGTLSMYHGTSAVYHGTFSYGMRV